jgi:hypothetical protein
MRFSVCTEMDSYAYAKEDANGHWVRYADLATLTQERDALRDVVQEIDDTVESIFDDGGLVVTHYKIPAYVISKALSLLTPSGEAGKGGGV